MWATRELSGKTTFLLKKRLCKYFSTPVSVFLDYYQQWQMNTVLTVCFAQNIQLCVKNSKNRNSKTVLSSEVYNIVRQKDKNQKANGKIC